MRTPLIVALTALSLLTPGTAQAAACSWAVTELPLPEGTTFSAISGAADDGSWVVGTGSDASWWDRMILWHNGVPQAVPLVQGHFPFDVNASGTVLVSTAEGRARRGGEELNPLPGASSAWAMALNASGAAVGLSDEKEVVIWPAGSTSARLVSGTDDGNRWFVTGIDNEGRVAATRDMGKGEPSRAFVWDEDGNQAELQSLPGHTETYARAIRNGRVVGHSANGVADKVGVEWDVKGNIVRTFAGSVDAMNVTASGDVLGQTAAGGLPDPDGIWRHTGEFEQPPVKYAYREFADTGDLYGSDYNAGYPIPVQVRCG